MTQQQKIVAIMCQNSNFKKWWKAQDLMNAGEGHLFIGYEATARLSEIIQEFPQMFEVKKEGRFRLARMRFENGSEWYNTIPKELQSVIWKYYRRPGATEPTPRYVVLEGAV